MSPLVKNKLFLIIGICIIVVAILAVIFWPQVKNIFVRDSAVDNSKEVVSLDPYRTFADIKENIVYDKVSGSELKLDLYYPKKIVKTSYPLVIYVHGGGWVGGDKTILDQIGSCQHLVKSGYAVASINYRLVPQAHFPEQVEDMGKAIEFLKQNADTYKLKTSKIGLMASSAGANLAAINVLKNTDPLKQIQGVVLIAPPTDLSAKNWNSEMRQYIGQFLNGQNADLASPVKNISGVSLPPFLLVQGDKDKVVPADQANILNQALRAKGFKSTYLKVENAGHNFNSATGQPIRPAKIGLAEAITQFFNKNIK